MLTYATTIFRYLRQLNIDKDILSMRNFNIYDPLKRGEGLILDGQTLAHIEVCRILLSSKVGLIYLIIGVTEQRGNRRWLVAEAIESLHHAFRSVDPLRSCHIVLMMVKASGCSGSGSALLCGISPISTLGEFLRVI